MLRLTLLTALTAAAPASAAVIAHWNFNDLSTTGGLPSNANVTSYASSSGTALLTLTGWTSRDGTTSPHGISNFTGSAVNALGADVSGQALALQGGAASGTPNNGASAIFSFDLTGYENPVLSFATQRTSTGFNSNQFAWSTDGVNFTDVGAPYNAATSFALQSLDLSAENALDDAAAVFVRITFSGATSNAGNNRLDNIQLNATAIVPEPSAAALAAVAALALRHRRRG